MDANKLKRTSLEQDPQTFAEMSLMRATTLFRLRKPRLEDQFPLRRHDNLKAPKLEISEKRRP